MANQLNKKMFALDYELLENHQYLNQKYPIFQALSSSQSGVEAILHNVPKLFGEVLSLVGLLFVVGWGAWFFLPLFGGYLVLGWWLNRKDASYLQSQREKESEQKRRLEMVFHSVSEESNMKDLHVFQVGILLKQKFLQALTVLKELYAKDEAHFFYGNRLWTGLYAFGLLLSYFGWAISAYYQGSFSMQRFSTCLYAVLNFYVLSESLFVLINNMAHESFAVKELLLYLEEGEEAEKCEEEKGQSESEWEWEVSGLSYAYPHTGKAALHNVSFRIRRGEKMAIVGLNGAGKSTLIKCMAGLYQNYQGKICWRGRDIRSLPSQNHKKMLGVLFQDADIYPFRLTETISSSLSACDRERVEQCLEQVGMKEKLLAGDGNPEQVYLRKLFHDDGIEVSGGEAQRIMIARLLYQNPEGILIDEATSKMDRVNEREMLQLLFESFSRKTLLFVTHHLSVTQQMERILVLKEGSVAEDGTPEELLQRKGEYYQLYMLERDYYAGRE